MAGNVTSDKSWDLSISAADFLALQKEAARRIMEYIDAPSEANYERFMAQVDRLDKLVISPDAQMRDDILEGYFRAALKITREQSATAPIESGSARIADLLTLAGTVYTRDKILQSLEGLLTLLAKGGAQIQEYHGWFVETHHAPGPVLPQEGENPFKIERAPKTVEIIRKLREIGVHADDLFIHRAGLRQTMLREHPYIVIDIPRLAKQITVCDQIGEIAFIAHQPLTVSQWQMLNKDQLRAMGNIEPLRYSRGGAWLNDLNEKLLQPFPREAGASAGPLPHKVQVPRAGRGIHYTEEHLKQWIRWFHEKWAEEHDGAGKWPGQNDDAVWIKIALPEGGHRWETLPGKNWNQIDASLRHGTTGMPKKPVEQQKEDEPKGLYTGLGDFKDKHGFKDSQIQYTVEDLKQWISWFHEKWAEEHDGIGRWPSDDDLTIWIKKITDNSSHSWEALPGITWRTIQSDLNNGRNGMPRKQEAPEHGGRGNGLYRGLGDFKSQHGFNDSFTEDDLKQWVLWFHEKWAEEHEGVGKWPSTGDKTVWIKKSVADSGHRWEKLPGRSWMNVDTALWNGRHGMPQKPKAQQKEGERKGLYEGLNDFRDKHGLNDSYTEEELKQWVIWFHEKWAEEHGSVGKWPSYLDPTIWIKKGKKDGKPVWEALPGKTWRAIDHRLASGSHGMPRKPGSEKLPIQQRGLYKGLPDFKKRHGLFGPTRPVNPRVPPPAPPPGSVPEEN